MQDKFAKQRKTVALLLVLVAIVIIIVMAVSILGNKHNTTTNEATNETTNYTTNGDGSKVNTSTDVSSDKKVGDVVIEQSNIVYTNGTSKLTSKVTNNGAAQENLRFTVKFIANDGSVIAQSVGYVGQINQNETRYIDSYITTDVSNAKDITYEVMQ